MTDVPPCGVCGLQHPHLTTCPFIRSEEIREEWAPTGRTRRLVTRTVRREFYARPHLFDAIVAAQEEPDAEDEGGQAPEAEAAQP